MRKRHLSIVFGLNISFILGLIAQFGMIYSKVTENMRAFTICLGIFFIAWFSTFTFLNVKNWSELYRYKWTNITLQLKWQILINPNVAKETNKTNWFIRNHSTFGNISFIYKFFGVLHVIIFLLAASMMPIRTLKLAPVALKRVLGICIFTSFLIPFVIYRIIVWKQPKFNDIFHIHWESRIHGIIAYIQILGYLLPNITSTIHGRNTLLEILIYCTIGVISFFCMLFVSTFMMVYKNKSVNELTSKIFLESNLKSTIGLAKILSNAESLNLFMLHLSREFNMECLLSVIELQQFQKYLLRQIEQKDVDIQFLFEIHDDIPTSLIVEEQESEPDDIILCAKLKAYKLYKKYIEIGSEFELNISSKMRGDLGKVLNDRNVLIKANVTFEDLLKIFDEVKVEMVQLLRGSLIRFREQTDYNKVMMIFPSNSFAKYVAVEMTPTSSIIV